MKKLYVLAILSLAGLGLRAAPAGAGCCRHRCKDNCHPYNAFSMCCCCVAPSGGAACHGGYCGLGDGGCGMNYMPMTAPGAGTTPPTFNAPMPSPADKSGPMGFAPGMQMMPQGAYQPAGYAPMYNMYNQGYYNPGYAPTPMQPSQFPLNGQTGYNNAFSSPVGR